MVTSFRHDREKRAERRKLLLLVLFLIAILFVFHGGIGNVVSSSFFWAVRPVLVMRYHLGEWWKENIEFFSSKQSLVTENQQLKEKLALVSLEEYSREELRNENEQFKEAFGRKSGRTLILARVLATPGRSPYDTLLIDAGLAEGITPGMKVFVGGDFAIGEVSRVMNGGAVVTLYSSHGNELPVTIGTSSIPSMAKGAGGGNFRIVLPRGAVVFPGDLVHIPAFASEYAGVVVAVEHANGGALQDIYLTWPFNVHELGWVYVAVDSLLSNSEKKKHE